MIILYKDYIKKGWVIMNDNAPTNVQIKALYAPGYSYLTMSYFCTNLTLSFAPWLSRDNIGRNEYDIKAFLSTSINHERAAFFYTQASRILDGKNTGEPVEVTIPCNKGATLTFEYKPDENNQMSAYMIINKNNQTIPFKFPTTEYSEKIDGQDVTSVMQTSLSIFTTILGCYIAGIAANGKIDRDNSLYNEAIQWAQDHDHDEWEHELTAEYGNVWST
jgi:hypothetical protein